MWRALYLFVLGAVFFWVLRGLFPKTPRGAGGSAQGEEMVPDPQCGVYIPKSSALTARQGGRQLYFCSEECRKKYLDRKRDEG